MILFEITDSTSNSVLSNSSSTAFIPAGINAVDEEWNRC